jgi:hypothetical protein
MLEGRPMDAEQFDHLSRLVGTGATRRTLLAALPSLLPLTAAAKRRRHKKHHHKGKKGCRPPCGACQTCVQKTCQPVPDGTSCQGGTCTDGVCVASGGAADGCTLADDGTIHLALTTDVAGQKLRLEQTAEPFGSGGDSASRTALTLNGAPLLTIATAEDADQVTVTLTYGEAVRGVRRALFTNDGTTLTGEIDGQPIAPLPADADPEELRLANGGLPPEVVIDPDLDAAIAALIAQAEQVATACQPPREAETQGRGRGRGRQQKVGSDPSYPLCFAPYVLCRFGYVLCLYGVVAGCRGRSGYICVALGLWACRQASTQCYAAIDPQACCTKLTNACSSRNECCGLGTSVDCASISNNKGGNFGCGFLESRGSTRCCRTGAGSGCASDCECCGDLVCINGGCTCRRLFDHCRRAAECCPTYDTLTTCAIVEAKQDGPDACLVAVNDPDPRFCCQREGAQCRQLCDCCGALLCRDGVCVSPTSPCVPYGRDCGAVPCCTGLYCNDGVCELEG